MESRPATAGEAGTVTRCVGLAFAHDPVWELALRRVDGRTDHHDPYWALFVAGALRHGSVFTTPGGEAVSVWLPPCAAELTPDHRYERAGFLPIGAFRAVRDDAPITAMWRDAAGPS